MTRALIFFCLLFASLSAHAGAIDCSKAPNGIEHVICEHQDLLAADRELAQSYAALQKACRARSAELRQTQLAWIRDRNFCWNGPQITGMEIERCVAARMRERRDQFSRIGPACDLDAVAGEYRDVEPSYLSRHAALYADRPVTVVGWIRLSTCDSKSADTSAAIMQGINGREGRFPVRFKAMPPLQREFLCAQNPFSHWTGTVKRDASGFFLYLNDVLGTPL